MPLQLISELVPVVLSIVQFDLAQGEDIFLTYTHGREHGPEIQRTGRGSPFMEHLSPTTPGETTTHPDGLRLRSWLIQEDLKTSDFSDGNNKLATAQAQNAPAEVIRVLQEYVNENPRLSAHDTEFINAYRQANQDYEIIGQQGCGDLTMNLWNVAYVNSPLSLYGKPVLIFLHKEPLASRTYSCLVKWKSEGINHPRVTIEDVRFDANAQKDNDKVWVERGERWAQCGDEVEFAVSNQQIIRDGRIVNVGRLTHQFSDLRHLLQMPNLNPPAPLPGVTGDPGQPRFYFGRVTQDDIWFGEAQLINDVNLQRAAMTGPLFFSRLYEGLGASVEQVRGALQLARYTEVSDPRLELAQGEFRFVPEDDMQVEVYLRRNTYGWTIIGLNKTNDKILCLACEGNPATRTGHVLEDAARKLLITGTHNALLVDEGADVFQTALLGHNLPKAKVVGRGPDLDITVPLKRTRLRATFIFARKRAEDGDKKA